MKKYWQFIKESRDTEIYEICKRCEIENYTINDDGSIDVDGDVDIGSKGLERIPIKFREVTGDFSCYKNNLTSLDGCPKIVGGYFNCSNNKLTSLKGCPDRVGRDFICSYNNLASLVGGPERVGRGFYCSLNNLITLEGFPLYFDTDKPVSTIDNPIHEIYKLFDDPKAIELMNDYGLINSQDMEVSYTILQEIFEELGKTPPQFEDIRLEHYTLVE